MKGRASLPGADELFRVTSIDGNKGSRARAAKRSTSDAKADAASRARVPSGRQRHEEKVTFYCTAEELMDIEHARLILRQHQVAVDRGRLIREALAQVLSELERDGADAPLVKRLSSR
jgi:capsid protein